MAPTKDKTGEQRIAEAHAANARVLAAARPDPTYAQEWKRYRDWVDENWSHYDLDEPSPYLTRLNVDGYFTVEVVERDGDRNTIRRIVNALTWCDPAPAR